MNDRPILYVVWGALNARKNAMGLKAANIVVIGVEANLGVLGEVYDKLRGYEFSAVIFDEYMMREMISLSKDNTAARHFLTEVKPRMISRLRVNPGAFTT